MRFQKISGPLVAAVMLAPSVLDAHNNPTFREDLLLSIEVSPEPSAGGAHSKSFELKLPDKTVQLIWRVDSEESGPLKFNLSRAGDVVLTGLDNEAKSNIVSGDGYTIAGVEGASKRFNVKIFASVLDRSASAAPDADTARGLAIYKKANCVGCHKWHGGGGGGYGGAAFSLRKTGLTRELLIDVVRCGRPGSGMPYHDRNAYGKTECYGLTREALGDKVPAKATKMLRPAQVEAVVDYVLVRIKGRGEPTLEECTAFWGERARQCKSMQ